jgi:DNA modification methylase
MIQDINQLILGDNLEILKAIESEIIDLIYLDPPFFSNRTYDSSGAMKAKFAASRTDGAAAWIIISDGSKKGS